MPWRSGFGQRDGLATLQRSALTIDKRSLRPPATRMTVGRLFLLFCRLRFNGWFRGHFPLRDGVVSWDFKQRAIGFAAAEIGQPVSRLGGARVAMLGHYHYL